MEIINTRLPRNHRIALVSDIHLGNVAMHEKGFDAMLERVERERDLYVIFMGDQIEGIAVDDKRFDPEIHEGKMKPLLQIEALAERLRPIQKKIITILFGNHEHTLWRFGDLTKKLCQDLDVPYGGYTSKVFVFDKAKPNAHHLYGMYLTHGRWNINSSADDPIRRESNMKLSLKRRLAPMSSDVSIMACGHTHRLLVADPAGELYLYTENGHIKSGYTVGEQGHRYIDPNHRWYCYDENTDILTESGFKPFPLLEPGELVASFNPEKNEIEFLLPKKIIVQDHAGKMVKIENEKIDLLVTPEHKLFVTKDATAPPRLIPGEDVYHSIGSKTWYMTAKSDGVVVEDSDTLDLCGKKYNSTDFMEFLGWYLSEGCITPISGKRRTKTIVIGQSLKANREKHKEILVLCARMFSEIRSYSGSIQIAHEPELADFLQSLGGKSWEKKFPTELKCVSQRLLKTFLTSFLKGDGSSYLGKKTVNRTNVFYTSSPQLKDDLQDLLLRCGIQSSVDCRRAKSEKRHNMYRLTELQTVSRKFRLNEMSEVDYSGKVYCAELEKNHILVVRRNNKIVFCGNCNTGSFLRSTIVGACSYSEFAGYAPIELGYPIVRVQDGKIIDIEKVFLGTDH